MASIQLRGFINVGDLGAIAAEFDQKIMADGGMSHHAAAEANRDLDPVSVLQELQSALDLGVEVVGVDAGTHTNLLDFNHPLILLGFLFPLLLIEAELGIVHNFADRGDSIGGDLYQVQALLLGQSVGLLSGHNAQLRAVFADDAKLLILDFLIELMI